MRFKGLFKFLDSFSGQLLTLIIGGIVLFQVANFAVVCSACSGCMFSKPSKRVRNTWPRIGRF